MAKETKIFEAAEMPADEIDSNLIGKSAAWQKVLRQIELVAESDATVLVTGESGTGKELIARAIHEQSRRREKPFVRVNCAAIAPELFESEFFGHKRGAFTGAHLDRLGRFGTADGGTILLDEVGEIPLGLQGKLLRVLQEGQYERVGEDRTRSVNVRVIAATNRDLVKEIEAGHFRQDLYYRLSVFPIHVQPLRERLEDVAVLAEHFLRKLSWRDSSSARAIKLDAENIRALEDYHYPGNVRELENIIERAGILSRCFLIKLDMRQILDAVLLSDQRKQFFAGGSEENAAGSERILTYDDLKKLERDNITAALKAANYQIYGTGGAANLLGTKPTTLASRIKALKIQMRPV
jgi:transcriptional regulator with GAF, ATPase, and Fis domain